MKTLVRSTIILITAFSLQAQTVSWKKAGACGVSFELPAEMTAPYRGQLGLDECAEVFESENIHVSVETNPFPFVEKKPSMTTFDSFATKKNFKRSKAKIASRDAVIISYEESDAEGFVNHAALSLSVKGGFRMFIAMKRSESQSTAERVFRSVVPL